MRKVPMRRGGSCLIGLRRKRQHTWLLSNSLHPTFYHLPTYPKPTSCLPSTFHLQTLYANHPRTETITSPVLLRLPLALAEVLFSPESFLWRSTKPSTIIDDHLPTTRIRRSDPTTGGLDPAPSSPRANDVPTPTIARSDTLSPTLTAADSSRHTFKADTTLLVTTEIDARGVTR
ncbi:hypothetical protein BDY24DRAFT_378789 [Mrakia frigida]|uniref:uncharacterized protein n=1 Tax=Mrakia frigida TaxID=29902 RepID=UPI003FCC1A39